MHLSNYLLNLVAFIVSYLQSYLKRFGYMNVQHRSGFQSMVSTSKALMTMQRQMGLEETGTLDKSTVAAMKAPRCGVPDVRSYQTFDGDLKWDHHDVTYRYCEGDYVGLV